MAAFCIGDRTFRSKGEALRAVQKVLHETPTGGAVDPDGLSLLRDLLEMHPHRDDKLRRGCAAIVVGINKVPGQRAQRGFYVVGDDGTRTEFSIYAPFTGANRLWDVTDAARRAVGDAVLAFKNSAFAAGPVRCAATGVILEWGDAHVHHAGEWPFSPIVREWVAARGGLDAIVLIDMRIWKELSPDDRASFVAFHDARAVLRIIHKRENSRLGASGAF